MRALMFAWLATITEQPNFFVWREYFRCDSQFKIQSSAFCSLQPVFSTNWRKFRNSKRRYDRRRPPSAIAASAGRQSSLRTEGQRALQGRSVGQTAKNKLRFSSLFGREPLYLQHHRPLGAAIGD